MGAMIVAIRREYRREYALPIKGLVRRNGQDFPACSIIIIHHNTKEDKFRGTTAIKNAIDETWNMRKLSMNDAAEMGLAANSRLVTVEKSREDREVHGIYSPSLITHILLSLLLRLLTK